VAELADELLGLAHVEEQRRRLLAARRPAPRADLGHGRDLGDQREAHLVGLEARLVDLQRLLDLVGKGSPRLAISVTYSSRAATDERGLPRFSAPMVLDVCCPCSRARARPPCRRASVKRRWWTAFVLRPASPPGKSVRPEPPMSACRR
jgi:hypothetical protein